MKDEKTQQPIGVVSDLNNELCVKNEPRFYVDERVGFIGVRDRTKGCEDYDFCAHDDDVMAYWAGESFINDFGHIDWHIHDWQKKKAQQLCDELNA